MKLTQLTAKPTLIKITIDDEDIVKEYGESIDFWMWDRQPLENYVKLAQLKPENLDDMIGIACDMILDEQGNKILQDGNALPSMLMTRIIARVVQTLGK